ncbi:MAG: DUF2807 domain-containing protein [Dehalococcoidales bacterium]|nr:DUF2807 domain-containing protein [Dehalococcoidales bacterium]
MKRIFTLAIAAVLSSGIIAISGCSSGVIGSGNLETNTYDYTGFTTIEAANGFEVTIEQAASYNVEITTDDNIKEDLDISLTGNTLEIGLKGSPSLVNATLKAEITMPEISGINLSEGSEAAITGFDSDNDFSVTLSEGSELRGNIRTGDIGFGISGGSFARLTGSGKNLMARSSSGSEIILDNFPVTDADINIDGGGTAELNLSGRLDTVLTGGSELIYSGDPEMGNVNVSGGSSLTKR